MTVQELIMSMSVQERADAGQWGRAWETSWFTSLSVFMIITMTPLMVFYFYIAISHFGGSLYAPVHGLWTGALSWQTLWSLVPTITWPAVKIYAVWVTFQLFCALCLPDVLHYLVADYKGGEHYGQVTPAGNRLPYQINGLQAWFISHVLFLTSVYYFDLFDTTIIFDHWGPLLWVTMISGYLVSVFVYLKAHFFPSHSDDRKFSGNILYDFYMGVEFNPRIKNFDFKLFFNGRPGIVAWTLINISFMGAQYRAYGYVTNSMLLVNLLHAMYVLDFFWNEAWYLNTIDICHEHFGWMLAWGDCVWLPYMYTLQGFYLVYNPVQLSHGMVLLVLTLGISGYAIFRSANAQKERFRKTKGEALVMGKQPKVIECTYRSSDGQVLRSRLLASGWWGVARHFNYTADLMGCLAYGLACGTQHAIPYFYLVYMGILLVHRCVRDEHRLKNKYGEGWNAYCKEVPYRMIPGIF